jgi:hypothetical protein
MSEREGGRMKLFILTLVIALSPVHVRADCPIVNFDTEFANAAAIFEGRAIKQEVVTTTRGGRVTETTLDVEQLWKGLSDRTVRVQTCSWALPNAGLVCSEDFHFTVGETYLVFASGQPLETSGCRPTERVDRADKQLQWLSNKPHWKIG